MNNQTTNSTITDKTNEKNIKSNDLIIFEHKSKQYKVNIGDVMLIAFDKKITIGQDIIFDKVLILNDKIGNPYLPKTAIYAKCLSNEVKGKKVIVFKYKSKKNYRVKTGFRAKYIRIKIERIEEKAVV